VNFRKTILLLLLGLGSLALASCNTVAGFGEDIQRAGEGLENTGQGRQW
jgi:predicted small secreted protein